MIYWKITHGIIINCGIILDQSNTVLVHCICKFAYLLLNSKYSSWYFTSYTRLTHQSLIVVHLCKVKTANNTGLGWHPQFFLFRIQAFNSDLPFPQHPRIFRELVSTSWWRTSWNTAITWHLKLIILNIKYAYFV